MKALFKKIVVALLIAEARMVIRKYKPSIIAVTGSVGKTSTKDAIYAALAAHASVRKSEKSFNSEIGIPLTILGCPNAWNNPLRWIENLFDGLSLILFKTRYPHWLVLEVGADRPGDIRSVAGWLPIDIAVITKLPEVPVHVEYFSSPEEVVEEKAAILAALKPSGTLIFYIDDERSAALAARAPAGMRAISFGFGGKAQVRGARAEILYSDDTKRSSTPIGMQADITVRAMRLPARVIGTVGEHSFLPLLAAAAVGESLNIPLARIIESFETNFAPPQGRMRLIAGIHNSTIIDDSYNASPAAAAAGIDTLASLKKEGSRTIAVLGDMLELGTYSVEEHRKIGDLVAQRGIDFVCTVGFRARDIAGAAQDGGVGESNILQFEDSQSAGAALLPLVRAGDIIYVKGSQSMRMERAVAALMHEPLQAEKLLVRQEKEWLAR